MGGPQVGHWENLAKAQYRQTAMISCGEHTTGSLSGEEEGTQGSGHQHAGAVHPRLGQCQGDEDSLDKPPNHTRKMSGR